MERFLHIDWESKTSVDKADINQRKGKYLKKKSFIDDNKLKNESVIYKLLTGTFTDPFKNITEEYQAATISVMNVIEESHEHENHTDHALKPYVPGLVKPPYKFPRLSCLTKVQQATCLKVLLQLSGMEKPDVIQTDKVEFQMYMRLKQLINKEQEEFLNLARNKWNSDSLTVTCEDYINLRWKSKMQRVKSIPRYYLETKSLPFVAEKEIEMRHIVTCSQGQYPRIIFPAFNRPYVLRANSMELEEHFPPTNWTSDHSKLPFELPVSEDPKCEEFAQQHSADLVISSAGLYCLANNIGPNYGNSWILPVVIKSQNGKNVIYVDKPLPPTANTIVEKNSWVYKYILRCFLVHRFTPNYSARRSIPNEKQETDDIFDNINSEEILRIEKQQETIEENKQERDKEEKPLQIILQENDMQDTMTEPSTSEHINSLQNDNKAQFTLKQDTLQNNQSEQCKSNHDNLGTVTETSQTNLLNNTTDKPIQMPIKSKNKNKRRKNQHNFTRTKACVCYNLFHLGPKTMEHNELMKTSTVKNYKVLVRTKMDGTEKLSNEELQYFVLAPKLEHQVGLGAEAVTIEEGVKQWMSLIIRPQTSLARVRISAQSREILQIEKRTPTLIAGEIKRLYNQKVEDSLTILHNLIQVLENSDPGRYILRHTLRNGTFATVYKEAENTEKNVIDLHEIYADEQYHTICNIAWPKLDPMIPTPMHKCMERMPAMYHPGYKTCAFSLKRNLTQKSAKRKRGRKKKVLQE